MSARDVMHAFDLLQPTKLADAVAMLKKHGKKGWVMAGGMDSLDWFKDRIKDPDVVISVGGIPELKGIRKSGGGLEIGALTTLTQVATDKRVRSMYPVLAEAASHVASPQIRNVGTLGGNACQDARCWYYRDGLPCYRAGGNTCYADTPTAINRDHCLFEADRCVAVSPSDTAPALVALEATFVVANSSGQREIAADDFFIGPKTDITRMTVLEPGDLLVKIKLPAKWAGKPSYFEKVADRKTWDFPIVNVAAVMELSGKTIKASRIVVGGVAARPLHLKSVDEGLAGEKQGAETAENASKLATWGSHPLNYNGFKVQLTANLVKRAVRDIKS